MQAAIIDWDKGGTTSMRRTSLREYLPVGRGPPRRRVVKHPLGQILLDGSIIPRSNFDGLWEHKEGAEGVVVDGGWDTAA